ncbi:hypothetical protein ACFW3C_28675, partial [Streptomyces sp. NPDC058871]|uniref:hypothetical protein n=2 Tax=unclassified Streptomyces TaxID=2593676 RepID=UPI0036753F67
MTVSARIADAPVRPHVAAMAVAILILVHSIVRDRRLSFGPAGIRPRGRAEACPVVIDGTGLG